MDLDLGDQGLASPFPDAVRIRTLLDGRSMKPRHAAALALVGWYLMVPPILSNGPSPSIVDARVGVEKPLSEWDVQDTFDSATECKRARQTLTAKTVANDPNLRALLEKADSLAQCVATDDPRLKGN